MRHQDGELSITVGGVTITGWQEISLTRGVEVFPPHFSLTLTDRNPGSKTIVAALPDEECVIKIGDDLVLTGYVNEYSIEITPDSHTVRLSGRGKCQDLFDCSAFFGSESDPSLYYSSSIDIVNVARQLASPYGIEVVSKSPGDAKPVYNMFLNAGETCFDVISRLARYEGLLVHEDEQGRLVLDRSNTSQRHAGGFLGEATDALAINIERASARFTSDQRYSNYYVTAYTINSARDVPDTRNVLGKAVDPNGIRKRVMIDTSPLFDVAISGSLAQRYADWNANRRYGRSQVVTLTVDSWRDAAGTLWTPNFIAEVNCPSIKYYHMLMTISEVTYKRSLGSGTTAEVTLMLPGAFDVEPIVLNQQNASDALSALHADTPITGGLGIPPT